MLGCERPHQKEKWARRLSTPFFRVNLSLNSRRGGEELGGVSFLPKYGKLEDKFMTRRIPETGLSPQTQRQDKLANFIPVARGMQSQDTNDNDAWSASSRHISTGSNWRTPVPSVDGALNVY